MKIKKHLKTKEELRLLQARINAELYEELRRKLRSERVKIRDFIEAAAKAFLDEVGK